MFFKIVNNKSPSYLKKYLPEFQYSYNIDRKSLYRCFKSSSDYFKNSFFPYCVREWNQLSSEIKQSKFLSIFKKSLLQLIRPKCHSVYNIFDPIGLKLLTRLCINLSHLKEHKFNHNFKDTINSLCSCNVENESTERYLLRCSSYTAIRKTLLDNIIDIVGTITNLSDNDLVNILLYGNSNFTFDVNVAILKCTITYLKDSERFDVPLL